MAIGEIVLGDPEAAVEAPVEAEEAVKVIAAATGVENAFIKAETVGALKDGTEAIYKLFQSTSSTVIDIRFKMDLPPSDINLNPAGWDVSGNGSNDADLEAIVNLAAWDDWTLQTDEQLAFAVAQNIGGAATYQLELRRHAIDGKLLTQARAQAVKLGQEFSRSWLQLHAMELNAARLQELLDTYEGEEEAAEEAQSDFYDRLLMLRTSIMIYMRDAIWAYKFYTMSDSSVLLDPLKTTNEYQQDSQLILQEVTACKEQYASDFTPFKPSIETIDLPLDYPTSVVKSLQSTSSVTITLTPATPNNELHNAQGLLPPVPGPFTGGSRFRVFGMRAFLLGAQPLSFDRDNKALVQLRISTSGVYADVQDGKVYGFTIKPLDRPLEYLVSADGTADPPIKDSIIPSEVYVDPTAFAQWTVKLVNPQDFDLKGLTGLKLYWEGNARFD
ncbi:hypothetical protein EAF04_002326 [Stromatinia cepivora]|nr:hypothetical protein EAF04_002326 [Stromatinia cepivora]